MLVRVEGMVYRISNKNMLRFCEAMSEDPNIRYHIEDFGGKLLGDSEEIIDYNTEDFKRVSHNLKKYNNMWGPK